MGTIEEPDHDTRELLLDRIRETPGISFGALMRSLELNEGTLRYHLTYLERKELIYSRKKGRRRVYFTSACPSLSSGVHRKLTREQRRVLNLIKESPGIDQGSLLSSMNIHKKDLRGIITKLQDEHLIWEIENGNGVSYEYITREKLVNEILLDLVERFLKGEIDRNAFLSIKRWLDDNRENS
ncbi:MAG: hypothetical protein JW939_03435 [Candidatus Thermoplasmatota archaeon]|nr:hypothetical protein [Candidatus Thermoplasmatota archaeon]